MTATTRLRARRAALEPPRYCAQCRRRMVVQVTPLGWTARCSRTANARLARKLAAGRSGDEAEAPQLDREVVRAGRGAPWPPRG